MEKEQDQIVDGVDYNKSATGWLIASFVFAVLGGLLGWIFALQIMQSKVTLPDGTKAYTYKKQHRTIALFIFIPAVILFAVCHMYIRTHS